jgi:hypothetical protein
MMTYSVRFVSVNSDVQQFEKVQDAVDFAKNAQFESVIYRNTPGMPAVAILYCNQGRLREIA